MNVEEGSGRVTTERLFELLDQSSRWHNDSERRKKIAALTAPNIFGQLMLKERVERSCDDAKHQEPRRVIGNG